MALAGLLAGLVAGVSVWRDLYSSRAATQFTEFDLRAGTSLRRVAGELEQAGVIDAAWKLRLLARLEGGARSLKAGRYRLPLGASASVVLNKLVAGEVLTKAVTLPEGWTARQIVAALADSLSIDREELLTLAAKPPDGWRDRLQLPEGAGLEGYLFPDTYRFAPGLSAREVLEELISTFEQAVPDSFRSRAAAMGFSMHEIMTLASIVETEARLGEEQVKVAAVYHNRVKKGWKLEADPTVAYALDKQGERLLFRDLEVDSEYNTYKYPGLPPGPIGSPGRGAIVAALWPAEGFEAMYFVADGQGGHVFSRTWREHQQAVAEYRRIRRQGG